MRWITKAAALLAVISLCAAGYLYATHRPSDALPFVVGPTKIQLGSLPPGEHEVAVTLTNPAQVPRRIVGLVDG
jgi:hypothetical protein